MYKLRCSGGGDPIFVGMGSHSTKTSMRIGKEKSLSEFQNGKKIYTNFDCCYCTTFIMYLPSNQLMLNMEKLKGVNFNENKVAII